MSGSRNTEGSTQYEYVDDNDLRVAVQHLVQLNTTMAQAMLTEKQPKTKSYDSMFKSLAGRNPPTYDGREDPVALENWIREFDKAFDALKFPTDQRVGAATYYLSNEADLWWQGKREDFLKQPECEWENFKDIFREHFYPEHLKTQKMDEFIDLKQGKMTIQEYHAKFLELARFAPELVSTERAKAKRFEGGLNFSLQKKLGGVIFKTIDEVYERAANLARIERREQEVLGRKRSQNSDETDFGDKRARTTTGYSNEGGKSFSVGASRSQDSHQNDSSVWTCRKCGKSHKGYDCRNRSLTCFVCNGKGHKSFECRFRGSKSNYSAPSVNYGNENNQTQLAPSPSVGNMANRSNFNYGGNQLNSQGYSRPSNSARGGNNMTQTTQNGNQGVNQNQGTNGGRMFVMNQKQVEGTQNATNGNSLTHF